MKKKFHSLQSVLLCSVTISCSVSLYAQNRQITGQLYYDQKPLSEVEIREMGSTTLTRAGADGRFQLTVDGESALLVLEHPRYGIRRVAVGKSNFIEYDFFLKENYIEEVVLNAGYYKVKERESTGSIARISAKDIENQPVNNVLQAAQGRMAGVSIVQNSGVPGGGFDVQIRGRNSLRTLGNSGMNGSVPLFVVNGVPLSSEVTSIYSASIISANSISVLNSINPQDIESIEVLKDADATAIYGSRGANGVVLISTKQGKKGRTGIKLNQQYSISKSLMGLNLLNNEEYQNMRLKAFSNDGVITLPTTAYDVNGYWDKNKETDWWRILVGNYAPSRTTNLSLSGGGEQTQYQISIGNNDQGTVFGDKFRFRSNSLNSSVSHRSIDQRFTLQYSNVASIIQNNIVNDDLTRRAITLSPNAPSLYKEDGSINWENNTFSNPIAIYNSTYNYRNIQFINQLNLQYQFLPHLFFEFGGGYNYQVFEENSLKPNTTYNPATATGSSSLYSKSYKNTQNGRSYLVEPKIIYRNAFEKHELELLGGFTFQNDQTERLAVQGSGFESNAFIKNISAAQTKSVPDQVESIYRYAALYGRIHYKYDGQYIVNLTGRRDGSSRFGDARKFGNFGAIGGAWLFNKAKFMEPLSWLSYGKIRGSYGIAGNDQIGDYQYLDTYQINSYSYHGISGITPSRLYNSNYSWEKTRKLEIALDLGFFDNSINVSASWYRNRTSNQLVGYQLPSTTGFTSVIANLDATLENSGKEFMLELKPQRSNKFQWQSQFNLSLPKNKLLSFPGLAGSTYANTYIVGESINLVRLYSLDGLDAQNGHYIFKDYNNDGKINSTSDRQYIDYVGVKYFGGWNQQLSYQNFYLSFLFQFVKQRQWNYNNIIPLVGSMNNQPREVLDVWSLTNLNGSYMPYTNGGQSTIVALHSIFNTSTKAVSDASYLRLKNVQITYQIPLENTLIKSAKVYLQGQNLWTLTSYFGLDPEFRNIGSLPPLKTYSFGVELNF